MEFQCDTCLKTFSRHSDLTRHKFTIHGSSFFSCDKCNKKFNRKDKFVEHCRKCTIICKYCDTKFEHQRYLNDHVILHMDKKFVCTKCEKKYVEKRDLQKHQQKCTQSTSSVIRSPQPGPSSRPDMDKRTFRCRRCTARFANRRELYLHGMQHHLPLTNDFTVPQLMKHAFRLNLEFGLILRHTETGKYRYFRPFQNESLFERPVYISRRKDLNRLRLLFQRFNVTDYILRQGPDTKWKPYLVTNVRFVTYYLNYPLGNAVQLPDYILQSKSIVALEKNIHNQKHYKDNICAFRCLAVDQGHWKERLETHTKALFIRWIQFAGERQLDVNPSNFPGLPLHQIAYFE
ncbi:KRAB [Mytilus coruscus]|uniref:KRAB n=1 Tax=Mytilus coruscus TaxID=42192 RepID=A0A6J8A3R6_MYTCO|nr:KRAB [Mytilus coruscus]